MSLNAEDARLLGASDFPSLMGLSSYTGPVGLWARMVHGIQPEAGADAAEGHLAEDYNRALYRRRTGYALLGPSSWRHPMHPWLRCSPDDRAEAPEGRRLVELKRYNNPEGWGAEGGDTVPLHIWVQVQVQQGVGLDNGEVDADGVDVSALLRGELRLYHVQHVPEVYERCLALGERFVRDFVRTGRVPEGDGVALLERDAQALAALYPAPRQAEPLAWDALTDTSRALVRRWLEANRARKAWEKQEKSLRGQVEMLLREAPGLVLPADLGRRVDFKTQAGVPRLDVGALRAALTSEGPEVARRMLALLDVHTKQENTRPLVVR